MPYKPHRPYKAYRSHCPRWLWVVVMWALLSAGMVAWQVVCVPCVDDRQYQYIPESTEGFWFDHGPKIETIGDAVLAIRNHHLYTPARLGNHLQTLSNLVPAWITRTLLGLCLACMFMLAAWAAAGAQAWRSPGFVAVMWLTLWVTLPLQDNMAGSDYAFNYFVPAALALTMALMWRRTLVTRRWAWLPWVVAFFTGCSHEGVSLPLAAALFCTPQFWGPRRWWYRGQWLLMVVMALLFLFSPGNLYRIGEFQFSSSGMSQYVLVNIVLESYGLYMGLLALLLAAWKAGWKLVLSWAKSNAVWISAMIFSYCLALWVGARGRVLWFCTLFGAVLLFSTLWEMFPWWRQRKLALAVVAFTALCSSVVSVAVVQRRCSQETLLLDRLVADAPTRVVYHDVLPLREIPWWTLQIPQTSTSSFDLDMMGYTSRKGSIKVLPTCMGKGQWKPVDGNGDAMVSNGYLIFRNRLADNRIIVTFAPDTWATNPIYRLVNFVAGRSGECKMEINMYEEAVEVGPDTIWLYWLPKARRLDRNREIIAVDLP
ncbi:MAG: DUF6056 family protein [Bacteroidales bacterium]|nr:DUF6056 family protein [Bacteroidales bacterium]